ncbi:sulfatase [Gayadomonas joobiniege]|uniref:sulfatase family protein n=1 Tax=Gayadomonas joobiniege TaxID=1234606 RepID=UPI00037E1A06|nr:sulfatase-like hydrolase/transferase [Gayadomonas joobiniege]
MLNKKTLISALFAVCASASAFAQPERPNIVVILADDLGYSDVSFNGSKDITTPNLDKLAANGTVMTSAYAAHPFCGPSRAGLMTGRYPHRFGSQFNLPTNHKSGGLGIPTDEKFISKVLQESGYYTVAVGKWHLGETPEYHPNARGFDDYYGFTGGGHDYFPEKYQKKYQASLARGMDATIFDYIRPLERNGKEVRETEYVTDGLARETAAYIDKASKQDKPFFIYAAFNAPHTPMQAKDEDMAMFPNIKDKKRKVYAGMVYALDRAVGRIVDQLKASGEYENTLIVFFSDNGGKTPTGASNEPLRGRKGDTLEGGYRVPMFFHWPNKIPARDNYYHVISALDLFPTFANLAGADLTGVKKLDGVDVLDAVINGENARPGQSVFAMRHRYGYSDVGVRKDNFKALRFGSKDEWQLYDVNKDPSETKDLSGKYPVLLSQLKEEAEIWAWQHAEPKWFHIHREGFQWREKAMPRFHETFNYKPMYGE